MRARGDLSTALEYMKRALSLSCDNAVYWNNYGVFLKDLRRHGKAQAAFMKAVGLQDDYADAWSNLGLNYCELGRLDDAERAIRHALRLEPRHADALRHMAMLYYARSDYDEALRLCRDADAVAPGNAAVYKTEGNILRAMKRFAEAVAAYEKAIACEPGAAEIHVNQGLAYADLSECEKAKVSFCRAAQLRPERRSWAYRHLSLCPTVFETADEITAYRSGLEKQLDEAWVGLREFNWRDALHDGFLPSFQLSHHGVCNRHLKEKFAALFAPHFPHERPVVRQRSRLRVGFTCTRSHEGGFVRGFGGVMERLDRRQFEVVGLVSHEILPFCRKQVRTDDVVWAGFPYHLERAFQVFREAECDVIMHWHAGTDVMNYFLPFLPLAPVQCIGFGTHGTTGIATIDYFISSSLFERGEDAERDYTEKLIQFEGPTAWQRRPQMPVPAERHAFNLPERGPLYFCPQRHAKFHPDFDRILRDILARDGRGHIVMLESRGRRSGEALRSRMSRQIGTTLGKRLCFIPSQRPPDYYRLLSLMDAVLDTPAYSASLTGYDALGLGVPVVTLPGEQMVQRYAYGLYTQVGVSEMIVSSPSEYVDLAVQLGNHSDFQRSVRRKILNRCECLFECESVVREYEQFFTDAVSLARDRQL